jgi:hypothetical protein
MNSHSSDLAEVLSDADLKGVRVLVVEDSWPTANRPEGSAGRAEQSPRAPSSAST